MLGAPRTHSAAVITDVLQVMMSVATRGEVLLTPGTVWNLFCH